MGDQAERPQVGLLDLVRIGVPDVGAALAFYRDVLGAHVLEQAAPGWARVRLANVDLGLEQASAAAAPELAFRVHDIAAFRRYLEANAVPIDGGFEDVPGGVRLRFRDHDGHGMTVLQYGVSAAALE